MQEWKCPESPVKETVICDVCNENTVVDDSCISPKEKNLVLACGKRDEISLRKKSKQTWISAEKKEKNADNPEEEMKLEKTM